MALFFCVSALSAAQATSLAEAPWRPEAAAWRATIFLGNLAPVPWDGVAGLWREPVAGSGGGRPPLAVLADLAGEEAAKDVEAALAAEDRAELFEAASRGLVAALLNRLDLAEAALQAGGAPSYVAEARAIYRAFEDGVAAADPATARRLGRAWLDLASAASARARATTGADALRFRAAKAEISAYVAREYAPATFAPRAQLSTLPNSAGAEIEAPVFLPPGSRIQDQSPLPKLVLNFEEQGIDEADLPLVAYGDMLFDSPLIFGDPARTAGIACSTCHNRSEANRDFFIPGTAHRPGAADVDGGFFNPIFNDRRDDPLDIPSLRGLRFTGPYGRDGRFASLRDFTRNVIVNEFAGPEPTPFMLDALVAYMTEFDFLPNRRLGTDGRLATGASEAEQRGEALFRAPFAGMDGRSCASCHVPSANFLDRQAHDIGSVSPGYEGARDGALDTPTLLGARFTAPYMHDGALPTLDSVVDWFDARFALGLSPRDRTDLVTYLEAIGDADEPFETFDAQRTRFRLAFEELTTFASTLATLIPRRDARHALLLIDTVAADLAAETAIMGNLDAREDVYRLAAALDAAGGAIRAGDWAEAEAQWGEFGRIRDRIDERMF
ncbi:MAG: cytochrome c peroxidase [Pikeienuella sp.]|uniref:cytochrome c peroxidase n=1 Tax=Pikeienuella sp. TaxID=2831957 RepID=UPI00391A5F3B